MADNAVSISDSKERVALELMAYIAAKTTVIKGTPPANRDEKLEKDILDLYTRCLKAVSRSPY